MNTLPNLNKAKTASEHTIKLQQSHDCQRTNHQTSTKANVGRGTEKLV